LQRGDEQSGDCDLYSSQQSKSWHVNVTGSFVKLFDSPVTLEMAGVPDKSIRKPSQAGLGGGQGCGANPVASEGAKKQE
jgi:hypothetical protein